jgi:protein-disulfide isomerase
MTAAGGRAEERGRARVNGGEAMDNTETAQLTLPVSSRDHVQGTATAPVTLVEYGDFECPYCGRAHPIVKALQRAVGNGMRFVYRHFPLTSAHPRADRAAEAAEAAGAQGKFWEMHDTLFEHQGTLDDASLARFAGDLGLDLARFTREMGSRVYAPRVREDFMSGVRSGVNGTPTFFINGVRHDGAYDVQTLHLAIQAAAAAHQGGGRVKPRA